MNHAAERIQRQMEDVRGQLNDDLEGVVDSAKELVDWRAHVRKHPWACVGAAVAIGYSVVPKRLELNSPDVDTLLELAKKNKLVVKANPTPQRRNTAASKLFTLVSHAAVRGGLAYLGQKLGEIGSQQSVTADEKPS
jgi:hypothetical protein